MDLGRVDLNLLVVLDALLREKNVTRAGERLRLSQSATSTALGRLRKLFDDPLLVRHGRSLQLTPRAVSLVEPVAEALAIIDHAISSRPEFDPSTDERSFTVVASDYVSILLIRRLLAKIGEHAPRVRISIRPVVPKCIDALERDEIDLGVLPDQAVGPDRLLACSRAPVITDRFVGVIWRNHQVTGDRLTRQMLATLPYLTYAADAGRSSVEDDLDELGMDRSVEAVASDFVAMPFMLRETRLVALMPERLALEVAETAQVRLLEPDFPLHPLRQSMFWHALRDSDPAHRWLRDQIRQMALVSGPAAEPALPDLGVLGMRQATLRVV
jgi:DNA-binding transcriptional LysR family regulator